MTIDLNPHSCADSLEIIYQDEQLVAISKPAGLLVHKSPIDKHETRYAMKILRDQIGQWVYPLHRLDKPTSGVLLFALDEDTARIMGTEFEEHRVSKEYLAIVRGYPKASGRIEHPLKEIAPFKSEQAKYDAKEAQEAITEYETLESFELPFSDRHFPTSRYSLIKLMPITGRKHQLRRHMKHLSHPIVGDVKHGKGEHNRLFRDEFRCHRLLLACTKMTFSHPVTEVTLEMESPLEKNFDECLNQLRQYTKRD